MSTLPKCFELQLKKEGFWNIPFTYGHSEEWLIAEPPTYDNIDCTLSFAEKEDDNESVLPPFDENTPSLGITTCQNDMSTGSTDHHVSATQCPLSNNKCEATSSGQVPSSEWYITREGKSMQLRTVANSLKIVY